jgi:redox-sensitive bicupin YhaK (pirin superfamily)
MILIHDKASRGHSRTGWLDSHNTFSFGGFSDPNRMGFGNLHVLNKDHVIPGAGFAPHRHESMDILTLVLSGARLMVLGGATLNGPRYIWWNFVSSSKDRILDASRAWRAADWQNGPFRLPPGDDDEFIPIDKLPYGAGR